jgi:hypothetical protein
MEGEPSERLTPEQAEASLEKGRQNVDAEIRQRLEADGWQRAGTEYPSIQPFSAETMRFDKQQVLTEDEIRRRYLEQYGQHGFDEVRIEASHNIDTGWPDESMVYVYLRRPEDKPPQPAE